MVDDTCRSDRLSDRQCSSLIQQAEVLSRRNFLSASGKVRRWTVGKPNARAALHSLLTMCSVQSIDSFEASNATLKKSILDVDLEEDLEFVPDFIWASPPCQTYSILAGGAHRSVKDGELDRSPQAREHNYYFLKMTEIMRWARRKHPHLIVVIENPVGMLKRMPLMEEFTEEFGLYSTTVDYCAFGRDEKKPTMLWTNDYRLRSHLSQYRCSEMCPFGKSGRNHLVSVQSSGREYDFSVIPQPLAEDVADYVNSKFCLDNVRRTQASDPSD